MYTTKINQAEFFIKMKHFLSLKFSFIHHDDHVNNINNTDINNNHNMTNSSNENTYNIIMTKNKNEKEINQGRKINGSIN